MGSTTEIEAVSPADDGSDLADHETTPGSRRVTQVPSERPTEIDAQKPLRVVCDKLASISTSSRFDGVGVCVLMVSFFL